MVRNSSPQSTPPGTPNRIEKTHITPTEQLDPNITSSVAPPSPQYLPSSTSAASNIRLNRLRRDSPVQIGLRAPQPPESPGGNSYVQMKRNARKLMGRDDEPEQQPVKPGSTQLPHPKPSLEYGEETAEIQQHKKTNGGHLKMEPVLNPAKMDASPRRMILSRRLLMERRKGNDESLTQPVFSKSSDHVPTPLRKNDKFDKVQRFKKMKDSSASHKQDIVDVTAVPETPHGASSHEPTDDEVTLTSVRQIVGARNEFPTESESDNVASEQHNDNNTKRIWTTDDGEEKSDEIRTSNHPMLRITRSSSTDYDTDAEQSRGVTSTLYGERVMEDPSIIGSQIRADSTSIFDASQSMRQSAFSDRGNRTYQADTRTDDPSYNYTDDDSQGSLSYEQRRVKEQKEREARESAVAAAKEEMSGSLFKDKDVDEYRKSLDTPMAKTALGVIGAATLGCIVMGPVGLLVGAAAVGIGVGVMQIPEEQRSDMQQRANKVLEKAQESALNASEAMSNSCANSYRDSGVADHMPAEINRCCAALEAPVSNLENQSNDLIQENNKQSSDNSPSAIDGSKAKEIKGNAVSKAANGRAKDGRKRVACMRENVIIPVNEIYALEPTEQPRAWLDVLASAKTSHDEKSEAMEEIKILAKDKQRARIFLEEGILDSLMYAIDKYLEKTEKGISFIGANEKAAAKLAAQCCLTLGKAHCALVHTEGDLLLMSLYERGTVPEERQLAQLLHEVPHHGRVTNHANGESNTIKSGNETFILKQLTLPRAEEMAKVIKSIADEANLKS